MIRRTAYTAAAVALLATLVAGCTLPAPVARTWKVKPVSVKVIDKEDADAGDEPYVMQLGFRSKLGVANSSVVTIASQCRTHQIPAADTGTNGTVVPVPAGSADIVFPDAQNLDIGDLMLENAPFEIFGTMSFVVERDAVFPDSCVITDLFDTMFSGVLRDALNLLIAASPVPPTQEQLINLIVSHLGDFLALIPGLIFATIEGLGDPDDILGIAVQIHLPTTGALADLINAGLGLAGLLTGYITADGQLNLPDLPPFLRFRIGNLLPSSATFTFEGTGYEHQFKSSVGS